jgi:thiamine pyrophosphate-dependent acetolactate synthase large subunit-like protein
VTGGVGVAAVTGGPGFTNALTAIVTAHRAGSGVLVVVGAGPSAEDRPDADALRGRLKYLPQVAVCEAIGIPFVKPGPGGSAPAEVRRALAAAREGKTVVAILASDVLAERVPTVAVPPPAAERAAAAPDPGAVEELVELLQQTWAVRRPVILAGRGAVLAGAAPALERLAELTGALLATSLRATGLFDGSPYCLGVSGTYSTSIGAELLTAADCVLAFGATLNEFTTYGNTLFRDALVVQVDTDDRAFGRYREVDVALRADARLAAEALVRELERRGHRSTRARTPAVAARLAAFREADEVVDASESDRIDPRILMLELDRILPRDRVLAVDGGHQSRFAVRYLRARRPEDFVYAVDGGSIGLGLGLGIGAAVARPGTSVAVCVGDAAMMMSLGDLETAVRERLPLVVVISNDHALGSEVSVLARMGLPTDLAEIPAPSFAAVAAGLGAEGHTISSVADLEAVGPRLRVARTAPLVLDCLVNPAVRA